MPTGLCSLRSMFSGGQGHQGHQGHQRLQGPRRSAAAFHGQRMSHFSPRTSSPSFQQARIFFVTRLTRCRLDVVWYPPRGKNAVFCHSHLSNDLQETTSLYPLDRMYQQKVPSNIHVIHVSSEGCAKNPKNPKNPQSAARQQFSRILFCCFCGSRSDLPNRGLHPGLPELPERSGAATLFVSLLSYAFIINFSSCQDFVYVQVSLWVPFFAL